MHIFVKSSQTTTGLSGYEFPEECLVLSSAYNQATWPGHVKWKELR